MNKNDEHLIFEELGLFDGYVAYPNPNGFVEVISHMDMEICLEQHPNWDRIRHQPPVLVYDCPSFVSQNELMDYFCAQASCQDEQSHISLAFDGNEKLQQDGHSRDYRLVLYSAAEPTKAIGFSSFDLVLVEDVDQNEVDNDVNLIGLKCDFYLRLRAGRVSGYGHRGHDGPVDGDFVLGATAPCVGYSSKTVKRRWCR